MSAWFLESELSACLQLLKLLASHDPLVIEWLKQKTHKYTSHKIQNKFLELMTLDELTVTMILDESTDVSNTSQAVVVLQYVTNAFDVHEEFISMCQCTRYHQLMQKLLLLLPHLHYMMLIYQSLSYMVNAMIGCCHEGSKVWCCQVNF